MKIEQRGIVITDVPQFDSIEVNSAEVIVINPHGGVGRNWNVSDLTELHAAIGKAIEFARSMTGDSMSVVPMCGPWKADDPEPAGIARVRDRDDDIWIRANNGEWKTRGCNPRPWNELLQDFGPVELP